MEDLLDALEDRGIDREEEDADKDETPSLGRGGGGLFARARDAGVGSELIVGGMILLVRDVSDGRALDGRLAGRGPRGRGRDEDEDAIGREEVDAGRGRE